MRRLLLLFILGCAGLVHAATITASGNASTSSNTNWSGGVKPNCTGDLIVTAGFAVTQDVAGCIIGDKSAATGIGVSCSASGGSFTVAAVTTFRGFNTSTAPFWKSVANCTIDLSGQVITYDGPTTYTTAIKNGIYIDSASTVSDIPAANITWSNSGTMNKASVVAIAWDKANGIYVAKIANGSTEHPGPIANAANNGLGSFGNTSIAFTSGGFDSNGGTTRVEKSGCVYGWTPTSVLATNGDFCVDYAQAVLWYKSSSGVLTVNFSYKYGTWGGWGIIDAANATNSGSTYAGTYNHCGDIATSTESSGGCLMINDHYAPGGAVASQTVTFGSGITFNYASRPIQLYSDNITGGTSGHHYTIPSPTFNYTQFASGTFQSGNIQLGASFVDITNPVLNAYINMFNGISRNSPTNIVITGARAGASIGGILFNSLPNGAVASTFSDCSTATPVSGFNSADLTGNGTIDGAFVSGGGSAGNVNSWLRCQISHAYRAGRLNNYMDVENMTFPQTNHHGFIVGPANQYIDGSTITFKNNITADLIDSGNFPGGITFSYNQVTWIDSLIADHNTFHTGTRCFNFNDEETSVALITRVQVTNSICSSNTQGIFKPAYNGTTNVSSIAIAKNDYNLDYSNTTNPTNLTQATFMRSGAEYNTGTRNVAGVYLFNPQGYTLPDATSRALVLTKAGTLGTAASGSIQLAWSSGAAVEFIADQGTLSSYSAAGSCPDSSACSQLTDSSKAWTASSGASAGFRAYQVIIVSGTGSGQYCMVASNTTTALTCIANRIGNNVLSTALDSTSKYILIKLDQQLFDSGGVNSVRAGIHSPTLVLTSQTDSGITMALNRPTAADPNYVDATYPTYNFHPRLATLNNTASDGTFIGALSITLSNNCIQKIGGSGIMNCGANSIGWLRKPSLTGAGF